MKYTALIKESINLCLQLTSFDNFDRFAGFTRARAKGLNLLNNPHWLIVGNLTKDDVLAIKPRGYNSGDEELRAIAVIINQNLKQNT